MRSMSSCFNTCDQCRRADECPLLKGATIEREHRDLYTYLKKYGLPDEQSFYKMIAAAHIRERPDYYDRLQKYVEG